MTVPFERLGPGQVGRLTYQLIDQNASMTRTKTSIEVWPPGEELVRLVRGMLSNLFRLAGIIGRDWPRFVLSPGTEPAAFLRGLPFAAASARVDAMLCAAPVCLDVFGVEANAVHPVHPHLFIKRNAKWMAGHRGWSLSSGRSLAAEGAAR